MDDANPLQDVAVTALATTDQRVAAILDQLDEAYVAVNDGWAITHVNAHAVRLFPIAAERLRGASLWEVFAPGEALERVLRSAADHREAGALEVWHDPTALWLEVRVAPIPEGGLALFLRDVSHSKQLEEERIALLEAAQRAREEAEEACARIAHRERHDPLTGACSRSEITRQAEALEATGGFLLTLRLGGLRRINELAGWGAGDAVLQEVVRRVSGELSDAERLGRRSGTRLLIVSRREDAEEVSRLAASVQLALGDPFEVLGRAEHVVTTIGIARVEAGGDVWNALRGIDATIGRIRSRREPRIGWYDDAAHAAIVARRRLASELREALERDRFVLRYAPVFDVRAGRMSGAQAELRWEHPMRGLVEPAGFLPVAQAMGVAPAIERWLLSTAIGQLSSWAREPDLERRRARPPMLWVPLSGEQILTTGFADHLLAALGDAELAPTSLGIVLTQPGLDDETDALADVLTRLGREGIRAAVDVLGTDACGVDAITRLPVDVLRVGQEVSHDPTSSRRRALLEAVLAFARAADAEVLVAQIETREQLDHLRDAGCDHLTGAVLGRTVPGSEFVEAAGEGLRVLRADDHQDAPPRRRWWQPGSRPGGDDGEAQRTLDPGVAPGDREGVTGLGGSRVMTRVLEDYLEAGRRPVLVYVEIDGFSALSLARGSEVTEGLLRAQARRLQAVDGARAFALDAGRFALVLPDTRRGPVSSQIDLVAVAKGPKGLTACVGIAHASSGTTPADLEQRAMRALRVAQRRGQGTVIDQRGDELPMPTATPGQARALYSVLREGYLRVHYQPILSLQDGAVVGFQALARPQLDHGLAGPAEAFQVAESLGLVPELDEVCRSSIFADGPGFDLPATADLYVTVAPHALGHQSLRSGQLIREIRSAGMEPSRVVLQLREHASVPPDVFDEEARWLRERGFKLALDGAGGETSGLRALAAVPFDHLKLSTHLLADTREDESAAAMLDALCTFALRSGVTVIATGVESPRLLTHARKLRGSGDGPPRIHAVQGYHLGKPRPQARLDVAPVLE